MKKILLLLVLTLILQINCSAQNKLSLQQKKEMVSTSANVELSTTVMKNAKEYAQKNKMKPAEIEKNFIHLQVIYNTDLSATSRIQYCDYLLELVNYDSSILSPTIIQDQKETLQKNLLSND